ncbi:hypothetical protein D9619_006598 [Psilocybe cf. subviscida]|uniref:Aminoglycoside phosphotransferase domain-containing protein n=1 Tax=Psilocybe cf. subviscida TaxID=2480587 RepID=A0A8H5B4Q2_9AGAR|nr:hypothetical protein D9619_006598 [Psilocybe cf. subviscida]
MVGQRVFRLRKKERSLPSWTSGGLSFAEPTSRQHTKGEFGDPIIYTNPLRPYDSDAQTFSLPHPTAPEDTILPQADARHPDQKYARFDHHQASAQPHPANQHPILPSSKFRPPRAGAGAHILRLGLHPTLPASRSLSTSTKKPTSSSVRNAIRTFRVRPWPARAFDFQFSVYESAYKPAMNPSWLSQTSYPSLPIPKPAMPSNFDSYNAKTTSISFPWPTEVNGIERVALSAQGDLQRVLSAFFARPIVIALVYSHTLSQSSPDSAFQPVPSPVPAATIAAASPSSPIVQTRQVHLQCGGRIVCTATSTVRITSPAVAHLFLQEKYAIGQMFRRMEKVPAFELKKVGLGAVKEDAADADPHSHSGASKLARMGVAGTTAGGGVGVSAGEGYGNGSVDSPSQLWRKYTLVIPDFECEILEVFPAREMFVEGEAWLTGAAKPSPEVAMMDLAVTRKQTDGVLQQGMKLVLAGGLLLMLLFEVMMYYGWRSRFCGVGSKFSDVDALGDEEIMELVDHAPPLPGVEFASVYRLTPGTVAKICRRPNETPKDCSEALILNTLFAKTSIPVPRVRRIIREAEGYHIFVMDHIKGRTLAEVWTSYSLWQKIRAAFTLRRYVRQLHSIKASHTTPPGPLSAHEPEICYVPSVFGHHRPRRGPFASYGELSVFFNKRFQMGLKNKGRDDKFDDSSPLVIVHNDLNPRNVIAGDDGRLWLIDWGWSGFYPPWFELVAMTNQVENEQCVGWHDPFWTLMVPFVCGPYFKQQTWVLDAAYGLSRT